MYDANEDDYLPKVVVWPGDLLWLLRLCVIDFVSQVVLSKTTKKIAHLDLLLSYLVYLPPLIYIMNTTTYD